MKPKDLNFLGSDPGAVRFGNFINYYSFHSAQDRISAFVPQMFPAPTNDQTITCLDIGCNTGDLTCEIYEYLKLVYPNCDVHILGIDIDPTLIERAKKCHSETNIKFTAIDVMSEIGHRHVNEYLVSLQKQEFDIIFCFSVTMWIHLNTGDEGLLEFLSYIKQISRSIVIEPQPWNCYRNAQRRMKRSGGTFPLYELLKIRGNVDSIIESKMLENSYQKTYESTKSSWKRKVQSYKKINI